MFVQGGYFDVPHGDMLFEEGKMDTEDKDGLMDTTINEAAVLYGFPVEFFLDVITRYYVWYCRVQHVFFTNVFSYGCGIYFSIGQK